MTKPGWAFFCSSFWLCFEFSVAHESRLGVIASQTREQNQQTFQSEPCGRTGFRTFRGSVVRCDFEELFLKVRLAHLVLGQAGAQVHHLVDIWRLIIGERLLSLFDELLFYGL